MTNKYKTTIRFEDEVYDKIKEIAEKENRSINNLVETWIKRDIAAYEKEQGSCR